MLEGFARLYVPVVWTLRPFVSGFLSTSGGNRPGYHVGSRGVNAGVRAYPNPGIALDVFIERRTFNDVMPTYGDFTYSIPSQVALRAKLTTHLPRGPRT